MVNKILSITFIHSTTVLNIILNKIMKEKLPGKLCSHFRAYQIFLAHQLVEALQYKIDTQAMYQNEEHSRFLQAKYY